MAKSLFKPIRKNETLKDRAVDVVTAAILNGMIKPGERVNESKLARELHISRAPLREALQQLQEQALMIGVPRRRTFVVTLDEEDIQKINSLRLVMEAEALRLARKNLTPQKDQELEQMVCATETAEPVPTISSMRTDFAFHQTIWSCSGNEAGQYLLQVLLIRSFVCLRNPCFCYLEEPTGWEN